MGLPRIIDVHIHLSERKDDALVYFARRNRLRYTMNELMKLMDSNGVTQGLLLSPPVAYGEPLPNEEVIALARKSKGRLEPVLTAEPSAKAIQGVLRLARREKVRAFKVRLGYLQVFASDRVFAPLYDYAESEGLAVMFHTGDTATSTGSLAHAHPLTLDALANKRPDLTIVACHFGNPWIQDVAELVYKHPNVFADISGLVVGGSRYEEPYIRWLATKLSRAIYFAGGAEKVFFGTDYPITTYDAAVKLVNMLEIDGRDRRRIFSGNAKKAFRM